MNAPTTHDTDNASEAQFLAPETHQRAGTEWQSYSTPERLADKAWSNLKSRNVERLLDACSGVGALAYAWDRHTGADSYHGHSRDNCSLVDAIEIDARHHPTLREKNYNVVGFDFLHHKDGVIHSHVIVNPPFAQGVHFALNAWDMLWEGEVVVILNADTLRNPFSAITPKTRFFMKAGSPTIALRHSAQKRCGLRYWLD